MFKDLNFEIKSDNVSDSGEILGYGSTFGGEPDSHNDIIHRGAFAETLLKGGRNGYGIPMLWSHDPEKVLGIWKSIEETSKGLEVRGQLNLETQSGREIHSNLKIGAVRGLSIGFNVIEKERDKRGIRHIKKVDLWEISLVTFPANRSAQVFDVKEYKDTPGLAGILSTLKRVNQQIGGRR